MIDRLVRASTRPFTGAFTFLENEKRLTVWKSEISRHHGAYRAVPGQLLYLEGDAIVIATGDGVLALKEVLLEGISDHQQSLEILSSSLRKRLF